MPDLPISGLTATTQLTADDLIPVVDDPGGTPVTQKITRANFGKVLFNSTAKTTNYTYTSSDEIIKFDTTSGNITASLPSAVGITGKWYAAIKTVSANSLIIDPSGTETINGSTTLTLTAANSMAVFYSDGSNWFLSSSGIVSPGGSSGQLQYNNSSAFGGTAAGTYATSGTLFTYVAQSASDVPLLLKGAASQSGNLLNFQNSAGTVLANVSSSGNFVAPAGTSGNLSYSFLNDSNTGMFREGAGDQVSLVANGQGGLTFDGTSGAWRVGMGTTGPLYPVHIWAWHGTRGLYLVHTGGKTSANYGMYVDNQSTSSTNSIDKYGLYLASTGTWNGTSARNFGFYMPDVTGGTTNYAIYTNAGANRFGDNVELADAKNFIFGTTTGTKIGTATTQKIGFWNTTPVVQPTTAGASATVASPGAGTNLKTDDTFDGYTLAQVVKALRTTGILA